jgi:hypothetical protein
MIKLSLCGKIYQVEKHILERSPYFKDIFDEYTNSGKELGELYIPRPSIAFDHILAYLIYNGEYKVPEQFDQDMKYFLLEEKQKEELILEGIKVNISDEECLKHGFKHGTKIILHDPNGRLNPVLKNKSVMFLGINNNKPVVQYTFRIIGAPLKDIAKLAD